VNEGNQPAAAPLDRPMLAGKALNGGVRSGWIGSLFEEPRGALALTLWAAKGSGEGEITDGVS
jgi:hypothetical protein